MSFTPRKTLNLSNGNTPQSLLPLAVMLGGAAIALSGCQSNSAMTNTAHSANHTAALIDFSVADSKSMQAQGQAFTQSLEASEQRYQQLFNQESHPNSDSQAKRHLISAIRQHLASEHVAVAKANYNAVPFINADSIDAGSTGLLRTIFEVYAYREDKAREQDNFDPSQTDLDDEYNYDSADEARLAADFVVAYSKDGYDYDQEGYDRDGYDENGFDRNGFDYDGFDENGYDKEGYDYYGYDENGEYLDSDNDNYNDDYDDESSGNTIRERLINNPKALLADFEAMQTAKQVNSNSIKPTMSPFGGARSGAVSLILGMLHKTPEQVAAANAYQYKYLTFNSVSQYLPKQRQFNSVYSYDYVAPTISSSVQLPIAFDFNNSKMTLDPAAIMPIVALANPENTPLQMTSHTVDFGLPETITSQLPPAVIYDAAINAMQASMAELAPEHFSAIDVREDSFAKQVGASRAVKVYFGSKQTGEIVGKMLKYMSQSLQQYVDANPSQYPEGALLKTAIDKIQLYNKGYQSADIGALLQLVEAVVPISFNQVNYYYLDSSDQLLAKQQRINFGGDLMGSNTTVVNEIRYDRRSFDNSKLTPLLTQAFGADALPAMDGNAWLAEQRLQTDRLDQARYARYDYDYDTDADTGSVYEYDSAYDRAYEADTDSIEFDADTDTDTDSLFDND